MAQRHSGDTMVRQNNRLDGLESVAMKRDFSGFCGKSAITDYRRRIVLILIIDRLIKNYWSAIVSDLSAFADYRRHHNIYGYIIIYYGIKRGQSSAIADYRRHENDCHLYSWAGHLLGSVRSWLFLFTLIWARGFYDVFMTHKREYYTC